MRQKVLFIELIEEETICMQTSLMETALTKAISNTKEEEQLL